MTIGVSDEPYSLMTGIAGDICFTMDVLSGVGYFPGYDLWIIDDYCFYNNYS